MVITIIANRRGLTDVAAVGIVEKMMSFLFLVPSSMLSTVSALGAQNIGAGKTGAGQSHPGLLQPGGPFRGVPGGAHGEAVYAG